MSASELQRFPDHCFGQRFTVKKSHGGVVEQRRVSSLEKPEVSRGAVRLDELRSFDLIVNCSGLGAKTLARDDSVFPVRGQVLKVEAPWIQHFIRDGDGKTYIYPGIRSVTIGGTRQERDWRLELDQRDTRGFWRGAGSWSRRWRTLKL
ncbi:hypothetical protein WMY93_034146 [Mugilogobius chulae]|uniref:D-aspartate oxidase n=1 Tax=Mugilogobius chulae TaxID=88201 RepID=A0AAW0ML92_9GOBI